MSVYSGFATRNQEMLYDNLIGNILAALSLRLVKFYRRQQVDERKFRNVLDHQCRYLKKLEKRKFLQPKYSDIIDDLLQKTEASQELYAEIQTLQSTPHSMNQTLAMITSELKNLKDLGEKESFTETNSLEKINEKVFKRKKKGSRSKKEKQVSIQYDLQELDEVKREKMPDLNNFRLRDEQQPIKSRTEWMRDTKTHIYNQLDYPSEKVSINEESIKRIMQGTKFRTKMFTK